MSTRIAINGFGRIGRHVLRRVAQGEPDLEVVAVNSVRANPKICAHLFKYDSVFGRCPGKLESDEHNLIVDGLPIRVVSQPDPLLLPWHAFDVDVEATGRVRKREDAALHLKAGEKKVLITAPAQYEDISIVAGVNDHLYDPHRHRVISAASCTTNCLAPVLKVLHDESAWSAG